MHLNPSKSQVEVTCSDWVCRHVQTRYMCILRLEEDSGPCLGIIQAADPETDGFGGTKACFDLQNPSPNAFRVGWLPALPLIQFSPFLRLLLARSILCSAPQSCNKWAKSNCPNRVDCTQLLPVHCQKMPKLFAWFCISCWPGHSPYQSFMVLRVRSWWLFLFN